MRDCNAFQQEMVRGCVVAGARVGRIKVLMPNLQPGGRVQDVKGLPANVNYGRLTGDKLWNGSTDVKFQPILHYTPNY